MAWHCRVEQIQALLDGELGDRERQECEAHLAECRYCASLLERLAAISEPLAAAGAANPPEHLREHIFEAVAQADPVPELSCEQALEMSSAYLDAELRAPEREALEAHLFTCPHCYAAFKQMEMTAEALRTQAPVPAPEGLHQSIAAAIERERRLPVGVLGVVAAVPSWRRMVGTAVGLAAAAAVLAALVLPRARQPAPLQPAADAVAEITEPVETPEPVAVAVPDETEPASAGAEVAAAPVTERAADEPRTSTPDTGRNTIAINPAVRHEVRAEGTERTVVEPTPPSRERVVADVVEEPASGVATASARPAPEPVLAVADHAVERAVAGAATGPADGASAVTEPVLTQPRPAEGAVIAVARDAGGPTAVAEVPPERSTEPAEPTRIASAAGAAEAGSIMPLRRGWTPIPLDATDPRERCAAATAAIKGSLSASDSEDFDRGAGITIW